MGGGGLRILGHKKWHVWKRENIEKVLKDERLDREKSTVKDIEQSAQDTQFRIELFHQKEQRREKDQEIDAISNDKEEPFELFPQNELFLQGKMQGNKEHEKETAEKKKREEIRPWGLGDSSKNIPWYCQKKQDKDVSPDRTRKSTSGHSTSSSSRHVDGSRRDSGGRRSDSVEWSKSRTKRKKRHRHDAEKEHLDFTEQVVSTKDDRKKSKKRKSEAALGKQKKSTMEDLRRARHEREAKERRKVSLL